MTRRTASGSTSKTSMCCWLTSMTPERVLPIWAVAPGIPSRHIALAALHAASILDSRGSLVADARESYWHHATGGSFPPIDMRRGERLLIDCGFVLERDGSLYPTSSLDSLLDGAVDDA